MLEIKNLTKKIGNKVIFSNLHITLKKNKVTILYGKNGAGKTTLLKCITAIESTTGGDIMLNGEYIIKEGKLINERIIREKIGIVFQDLYLWNNKTCLNNIIESLLFVKKITKVEAITEAKKIAKKLHIDEKIFSMYPPEISRGQRQRVAIARTLVLNPKIVLLDEPTASLDLVLRQKLVELIKSLCNQDITFLIVTHDPHFAKMVGDYSYTL